MNERSSFKFIRNTLKTFCSFKVLLFCSACIFLGKVVYSWHTGFATVAVEDAAIAKNLAAYGVYAEFLDVGPTAYKLPLYPLFLCVFYSLFSENAQMVIIIVQHFFYFLIPLILAKIGIRIGWRNVGYLGSYLFLLSPAYFYYSTVLESTNIFLVLFVSWLYLYTLVWLGYKQVYLILFLAVNTALLFLTQVTAVPIVMLLLATLFILQKINIRQAMIIAVISLTLYSPWVIRNYLVFDKMIISKTPVWQNIYLGYVPRVQIFDSFSFMTVAEEEDIEQKRFVTDEFTMERLYETKVKQIADQHPHAKYKKALNNLVSLSYVPARYIDETSWSYMILRKIYVLAVNISTLIALCFLYRRSRKMFFFSIVLFGNFTIPYLIGHAANTRFKLDFEWYQLILIAYLITVIFNESKFAAKFHSAHSKET